MGDVLLEWMHLDLHDELPVALIIMVIILFLFAIFTQLLSNYLDKREK